MFGAGAGEFVLLGLDGAAEEDEFFGEARAFGFGFGAAEGGGGVLVFGAFGALAGVFHIEADARELVLANG